ncbi:MAG: SAM-dependent methyltransferase [Thermomicrobiales bacterium]
MGTLFLVATPIGNLGDMTQRAIETLGSVSLIAAEDTRRTRRLLDYFGIDRPMTSYHQFNERARRDQLLAALADGDVAIVTDAGTPAIAGSGGGSGPSRARRRIPRLADSRRIIAHGRRERRPDRRSVRHGPDFCRGERSAKRCSGARRCDEIAVRRVRGSGAARINARRASPLPVTAKPSSAGS